MRRWPISFSSVAVGVALALQLGAGRVAAVDRAAAPEALAVRSFTLAHRSVDEAYALAAPYLSERAEVIVRRASGEMELHDEAPILAQVATLLEAFDVPPRVVYFEVRVVKGERREEVPVNASSEVPPNLRDIVYPNTFSTLGAVDLEVREGRTRRAMLDGPHGFQVEIEIGGVSGEALDLRRFSLERGLAGADGRVVSRPVLQFSEALQIGKRRILVATPTARDSRALFLIVTARLGES